MSAKFTWLIAGLGNPGEKYAGTRHNFGFMVIDVLLRQAAGRNEISLSPAGLMKHKCQLWRCQTPTICHDPWLAAKPLAFMNLSGLAIAEICRRYYIDPKHILVIHDELDLPLGKIRLKSGGGLSGHNGLISIAQHLGHSDFHRLRLGIGHPQEGDAADFVLSRFNEQERTVAEKVLSTAAKALQTVLAEGMQKSMNLFNSLMIDSESIPPSP